MQIKRFIKILYYSLVITILVSHIISTNVLTYMGNAKNNCKHPKIMIFYIRNAKLL